MSAGLGSKGVPAHAEAAQEGQSMSVVAVRDGIMAADTIGVLGGVKFRSPKLYRRDDTIIGVTGNTADGQLFVDWYFDGADHSKIPETINRNDAGEHPEFFALVLTPDGFEYWDHFYVADRDIGKHNEFMAIGKGSEAAMGAMWMGADAIRAVEAACAVIRDCALPVEHEEL